MGEQGMVECSILRSLSGRALPDATGSVIAVTMEGTRPLLSRS